MANRRAGLNAPNLPEEVYEAYKNQTVLKGTVKLFQPAYMPGEEDSIIIDMPEGYRVLITKDEVVPLPKNQRLGRIVGNEIEFIITSIPKVDVGFIVGSNKLAVKKINEPFLEKLHNHEVINGQVIRVVDHGAYVSLGGTVVGVLRNEFFAVDTTRPKGVLKPGDSVNVKWVRTTNNGNILLEAEPRFSRQFLIQNANLTKGTYVLGTVSLVRVDGAIVNIDKGLDIFCKIMPNMLVEKGDTAKILITQADAEKKRTRGKIVQLL